MLANRVEIAFFSPRHLSVGFNFPSLPSPMMRRPTSPTIFAIAGLTRPLFAKLCTDSRLNRMEVCFWYSKSSLQIDSNAVPFSTNSFIFSKRSLISPPVLSESKTKTLASGCSSSYCCLAVMAAL